MTPNPDAAQVADAYSTAWNSRDVGAILALHAEESSFQVHGRAAAVRGTDALRVAFEEVFDLYPGFTAEEHRLMLGERHWALDWTLHFEPSPGDERRFGCIDVVEFNDDGLVTRKDTYVDRAAFLKAIG